MSWRVTLRGYSGKPLVYRKDYSKKGVGLVSDLGGRFVWEAEIYPDEEGPGAIMDAGYVSSLKEGKGILDDYFELVGEYEY